MIQTKTLTMTTQQWSNVADCPIQRDTEIHARKAINNHLQRFSPTHKFVSAFETTDGQLFKLDGHTRSYLWDRGQLEAPDEVFVTVYLVPDINAGEDLYRTFDNQAAAETAGDKLAGAFSKNGFLPESLLIKHGGITSAIRILTGRSGKSLDIYKDIIPWLGALKIIDRQMFSNAQFPSGILAAAILSARVYGEDVIPFWAALNNDEGVKAGKKRDGVQALSDLIAEKRIRRQISGSAVGQELLSKSISCIERWRRGEYYTVGIKGTDMSAYLSEKLGEGFRDGQGSKGR